MTKTANYQLNQWGENDYVKRADFNADNQKIDAAIKAVAEGGIKLVTGSYVGTGSYGASNPNTLTFDFSPKVVLIRSSKTNSSVFLIRGTEIGWSGTSAYFNVIWGEKTLSWYAPSNGDTSANMLNAKDAVYHYFAIG